MNVFVKLLREDLEELRKDGERSTCVTARQFLDLRAIFRNLRVCTDKELGTNHDELADLGRLALLER